MGKDRLTGSSHRHTRAVGEGESSGLPKGQKSPPGDAACVLTIDTHTRGQIPWSVRDSQQQFVLCPRWVLLPGDIRCSIRCHLLLREFPLLAGRSSSRRRQPCPALSLPPSLPMAGAASAFPFPIQYNPISITLPRNPEVPSQEDRFQFRKYGLLVHLIHT